MDDSGWFTQQLAEFIAAVSAAEDEAAAALAVVERAAEALDAEVAAIVHDGNLVAAVGYPEGSAPVDALVRVRPGVADGWLDVPGVGPCPAVATTLEHPSDATLVVARRTSLTRQEVGLLQGMARVGAMTMRVLNVLAAEHTAREEVERLAHEQTALRQVATLVAKEATADEVFSAVAAGVGRALAVADYSSVGRYDPDGTVEIVGSWSRVGDSGVLGRQMPLGGRNVTTLVFEHNAPARVDHLADPSALTATVREVGARSSAGAPIAVAGRLWGVMIVASARDAALPADTEYRLAEFTELVATAISNAEAREQLRRVADEQAALRRVATLVAREAPPTAVFAAVAEEAGRLIPAELAYIGRYQGDGTVTFIGGWHATGDPDAVGTTMGLGGRNVCTIVFETGRPARLDDYAEASGAQAEGARESGVTSTAGVPITVSGRLWGMMIASATGGNVLPAGTEKRLAEFTELVATAIANTEAREELRRVADEQAALRRVATLVARGVESDVLFDAVAEEVGALFAADLTGIARFEPDGEAEIVGGYGLLRIRRRRPFNPDPRLALALVQATGRAARLEVDDPTSPDQPSAVQAEGIRSEVASPIVVEGRVWGAFAVGSRHDRLPLDTEGRLVDFTKLVATAIANTQTRQELRTIADEQAALRRVATLVARAAPPAAVFAAVAEEVGGLLPIDIAVVSRYDVGGTVAIVGAWSRSGHLPVVDTHGSLRGHNVSTLVFETGLPARIDAYSAEDSDTTAAARKAGVRSAVGTPISVAGRLWGVMIAAMTREGSLPAKTETRLNAFTELVATAIANAEAQAELAGSRARIVATADETRQRIERDLHDGAQQRLVSLALQLRAAQAAVPPELDDLAAELDAVSAGLIGALDELREFARGIHPAILAEGGLGPALRTLARRSGVPVELRVRTQARLPERVEVTAYYVVSEALANAAKHANASAVTVDVSSTQEVVRLTVQDDGVGGADPARGSGLIGLKDRVAATGGKMLLRSRLGEGTRLDVELPLGGDRLPSSPY